jgi:hypothetical protein
MYVLLFLLDGALLLSHFPLYFILFLYSCLDLKKWGESASVIRFCMYLLSISTPMHILCLANQSLCSRLQSIEEHLQKEVSHFSVLVRLRLRQVLLLLISPVQLSQLSITTT